MAHDTIVADREPFTSSPHSRASALHQGFLCANLLGARTGQPGYSGSYADLAPIDWEWLERQRRDQGHAAFLHGAPPRGPALGKGNVRATCPVHGIVGTTSCMAPKPRKNPDITIRLTPGERRTIDRDVCYEDSDHHKLSNAELHRRLYPRLEERELASW